jgi:hypothetical protein
MCTMPKLIIECEDDVFFEFKRLKLELEEQMKRRLKNEDVLRILMMRTKIKSY